MIASQTTGGKKSGSRRRDRAAATLNLTIRTRRGGLTFATEIKVTGTTAASVALLAKMPQRSGIWPAPHRADWLAQLVALSGIDDVEGPNGEVCDRYLSILTAMLDIGDVHGRARRSVNPRPDLRVVGGYERAALV